MMIKKVLLTFLAAAIVPLQAIQGMAVACNDKYIKYYLPMLAYLRYELKSEIPVEIWYAGGELSFENKQRLKRFSNISLNNIADYFGVNASEFWGYQIKGYMLKATHFDEVIIADADVYFVKDPALLFNIPGYKNTGAYFFRDIPILRFTDEKDHIEETQKHCGHWGHGFIESYRARRAYFRSLVKKPSAYMPHEFRFFWTDKEPTKKHPFLFHYQESGVVVMDKKRHKNGIDEIYKLNKDYKKTYLYVMGDKETYWLGMERAKEPYAFNPAYPVKVKGQWDMMKMKPFQIRLAHTINDQLFWFQRRPIPLGVSPYIKKNDGKRRPLTKEEISKLNGISEYIEMFSL